MISLRSGRVSKVVADVYECWKRPSLHSPYVGLLLLGPVGGSTKEFKRSCVAWRMRLRKCGEKVEAERVDKEWVGFK